MVNLPFGSESGHAPLCVAHIYILNRVFNFLPLQPRTRLDLWRYLPILLPDSLRPGAPTPVAGLAVLVYTGKPRTRHQRRPGHPVPPPEVVRPFRDAFPLRGDSRNPVKGTQKLTLQPPCPARIVRPSNKHRNKKKQGWIKADYGKFSQGSD